MNPDVLRFPAEWEPQSAVLIAWPHADTDWAERLGEVEETYIALVAAIARFEGVLICVADDDVEAYARARLSSARVDMRQVRFVPIAYDDTWLRDSGPITLRGGEAFRLMDFRFTGWGGKFEAALDSATTSKLDWNVPVESVPLVMEGGSLEINSHGQLLTTRYCLMNPNRNPQLSQADVEAQLEKHLGATQVWWLNHGDLEGDDTDAHIDTLARFCDDSTIAYVQCTDKVDSHYDELAKMEQELQALAATHQLKLVPLPMTPALFDDDGQRLPATYANFLIINGAVLLPVYGCDTDALAISQMQKAFPNHDIVPIDCLSLTWQHGSLHCVTMQLPQGVRD